METKKLSYQEMEMVEGGWYKSTICATPFTIWGSLVAFGVGGPAGLAVGLAIGTGASLFCGYYTK